MIEQTLFPLPEPRGVEPTSPTRREDARILQPDRFQAQWQPRVLDETLPQDHPARALWDCLDRIDLERFYRPIKAVVDHAGRPTTDPKVLLGVWMMGILDGVGSARQLARLCDEHDAYRWLRGGVPINYHMLSDFRVDHEGAVDELMTQVIGRLWAAGVVPPGRVAQDGMRVRASAGAASFRRRDRVETCLEEARAQVAKLAEQREHPDPGVNKRQRAALERAARERVERVEQALACFPKAEAAKAVQLRRNAKSERGKVTAPRVSTTDPDVRVMKMADGGFRPAVNVQFATVPGGVIVGASVTASGSDAGQSPTMVEQVERRTGQRPTEYLMDGGFAARGDITTLERLGIAVHAPVRLPKWRPDEERYKARYGDTPEIIGWRERMATPEAKEVYRQRAAIAEWTNAQVSQHGLTRFTVRGLTKVTTMALLVAIAHNLMRWITIA